MMAEFPRHFAPSGPPVSPSEAPGNSGSRSGVPNQGLPQVEPGGTWKSTAHGHTSLGASHCIEDRNRFGINGISTTQNAAPLSVNVPSYSGPGLQGQSFMNGPSGIPPSNFSQTNQPYQPKMSDQGQFHPAQHIPSVGQPVLTSVGPTAGRQSGTSTSGPRQNQVGSLGPSNHAGPSLSHSGQSTSGSASEGPSSQRSSNTNSPATLNTNLDALEGQFRSTPDHDTGSSTEGDGNEKQLNSDVTKQSRSGLNQTAPSVSSFQPPGNQFTPQRFQTPARHTGSGSSQPQFPAHEGSGYHPNLANQGPRFPPTTAPVQQPAGNIPQPSYHNNPVSANQKAVPAANQIPRFPMPPVSATQQPPGNTTDQRPGFPPPGIQQFPVSSSQQTRFPLPVTSSQQTGFSLLSASSQRPGFQPPPAAVSQVQGLQSPSSVSQPPPVPVASQRPGFPQMSAANQRPGFQPHPMPSSQPAGFPPPMSSANQQLGFPLMPAANQRQGFPPPPTSGDLQQGIQPIASTGQRPEFPPPPTSASQQPGFPPMSTPTQRPGFPPPPILANQRPGFPPTPISANQQPGFPPSSTAHRPGLPPPPTSFAPPGSQQQGFNTGVGQFNQPSSPGQFNQVQPGQKQGTTVQEFVNAYPTANSLNGSMGSMSIQPGSQMLNLLQVKNLIPREGVEMPKPNLPNESKKVNCSPEVFRCTLNAIPQTSGLLNKARLPLGILIHPFKDLSSLPVIQSSVIVRCRSCRTYINPFVYFVDSRRWKCNLCYRVNELPDEFSFDPVSKTYGDPQRRPEIKSATIEFIAPSEYMLRPPQPAVYLYLFDVSFNAVETGYLNVFCETLLDVIDKIPGDSRTQIGFIAYDSAIHFFNLAEGLSQPQMLTVSDVEDVFLPCPDSLLVNLNECRDLVVDLLNMLPSLFEGNIETGSALGAALQAGFKMTSSLGGRITVMQSILPTVGPGALQNREDASVKASKDVPNLGPATDFYKKLALDCSAQQIAVDLFMLNSQYIDMASVECISKFSGGCVYYYPMFHHVGQPHLAEKFEVDLRRYFTRKIGFESVMRIRCSKGLSIHTFHGNFFVRSTDLLSLPNINPDAGFGMQMSIEESLTDMSTMCFQAALLYTSSKGERRIRVHTLCLPITNQLSEIYAAADQQAIVALLAKMGVDRCISSSMSDAREAVVNAVIDVLNSYGFTLMSSQRVGSLCINESLRLMPLYCLALLKSRAFRVGVATRLDDRVYALSQCKTLPVSQLIQMIYPDLYPVHSIMDVLMVKRGSMEVPNLPVLQLSSANIDRFGAYLLDTGETIYLYVGSAVSDQFCMDILDKPKFAAVKEGGMSELPELENKGSERLRSFLTHLLDSRPNGTSFIIVREDGKYRMQFFQHFVEDRTESSMSYYEFLQHIQKQVKS